jgi:hypothetical protein
MKSFRWWSGAALRKTLVHPACEIEIVRQNTPPDEREADAEERLEQSVSFSARGKVGCSMPVARHGAATWHRL